MKPSMILSTEQIQSLLIKTLLYSTTSGQKLNRVPLTLNSEQFAVMINVNILLLCWKVQSSVTDLGCSIYRI